MRLLSSLTVHEVAYIAQVKSRKTIMNWELDKGTPNVNQCLAIMNACGWSVDDFIKFISAPLDKQPKRRDSE